MKTTVFKIAGIAIGALVMFALVMTAANMDKNTGFVAAGKKWINDIAEATTGKPAFIEEYVDIVDEPEPEGSTVELSQPLEVVIESEKTVETQPASESVIPHEEADDIVGGDYPDLNMFSDDEETESESKKAKETQASMKAESTVKKGSGELPDTYDEFAALSLAEKIAIADILGDGYDAWVIELEKHKDDGYTVISAGSSVEELE